MRVSTARDLGALVRQERQDQGLTQAELAERIGTTRQWVSQFESGTLNPRVGLVLGALAALDLDLDVRSSRAQVTERKPFDVMKAGEAIAGGVLARAGAQSLSPLYTKYLREQGPNIAAMQGWMRSTEAQRSVQRIAAMQGWMRSLEAQSPLQRIVAEQAARLRAIEARSAEPSETVDPEQ